MIARWTLIACAVVLAMLGSRAETQEKGDVALEGKWSVVALTQGGKEVRERLERFPTFYFKDALAITVEPHQTIRGAIRVDAAKNPKQFELEMEEGGIHLKGIYKAEKDAMTLCFADAKDERPAKFASPVGSRQILLVLKRSEATLTKATLARLEGAVHETMHKNRLKQIGLALHYYHDENQRLPASAIFSKDGKPLLSWRVAILPHVGETDLYHEFKLFEPWDSEHNKKLLAKMPKIYAPVNGVTKEPYSTYFRVFTGPGTAFEGTKGMAISSFLDGLFNTVLVVEASESVPWTKPDELPYRADKDLPPLGGAFADALYVLFGDASVRALRRTFDAATFRPLITRNDGQEIDWKKLDR